MAKHKQNLLTKDKQSTKKSLRLIHNKNREERTIPKNFLSLAKYSTYIINLLNTEAFMN